MIAQSVAFWDPAFLRAVCSLPLESGRMLQTNPIAFAQLSSISKKYSFEKAQKGGPQMGALKGPPKEPLKGPPKGPSDRSQSIKAKDMPNYKNPKMVINDMMLRCP